MGTSRTNEGPGDRTPLLPAWALPGTDPYPVSPDLQNDDAENGGDVSDGGQDGNGQPQSPVDGQPQPVSEQQPWRAARRQMNSWVRAGGGRTENGIRPAGRAYVRAKGGSRSAATQATAGRAATERAGNFFGALARGGLSAALRALGLLSYVGRGAEEVFAAIANAIAPSGATLEEAAARRAANEVLAKLYEERVTENGDLSRLEQLTAEDVGTAVRDVVSSYVYQRWLEELGRSIEDGTTSPSEAVKLEREVRQYVRDIVLLEIPNDRLLAINWESSEGQSLVQQLFEEAYGLLEVEE